ncbi:SusC/RagA family TonB-linked outer membrane protein [Mucilaginibacter sp.]|uniref:SusC/RagA family TonB-linked outer membrane protein n=1 Tax=Mucilaginibacter sp. TaxID=1882438 RepID=UPI003D0FC201
MKISTFIITFFLSTGLALAAGIVKGQDILKKHVTVSFKNTLISAALDDIALASGVKFTYNGTIANSKVKVSASANNKELGELLKTLLTNTPYAFEVMDDEVLIKTEDKKEILQKPAQRILTGKVIDEKGIGLPGVSVKIKGTDRGGITDIDGKYQIQVNNDAETLVFSFVGYTTKEVVAGSNKTLDVQLEPTTENELKEVAVVAYGTQKKVSLVGAQSSINITDLKQPVSDVTTLLAGQISGIIAVQRSGEPGSNGANIWIRGIASFGNSTPLILVDGVERSINNIEPEDIQSFTILKDASATAVYGVRGANGVIIIQTKRGVAGKPKINADIYEGINSFTRVPQMADGVTFMNMVNEALTTRGQPAKYSNFYIQNTQNKVDPLLYPNVNWIDAVFNKYSHNRRANLNVSGGVPSARYYVSASYYDETGLLKTDQLSQYNAGIDYGRYNFTSNLNLDITSTSKLDIGVSGYVAKGNYPAISASDIFTQAMIVAPTAFPIMYPGGLVPGTNPNGDQRNPYADLTTRGYQTQYSSQLNSNIRFTQDLKFWLPGLSFSTMFSYDINTQHQITRTKREDTYFPDATNPRNLDGSLNLEKTYTGTSTYLNYAESNVNNGSADPYFKTYTETSLNYDHSFSKHHVGALLLFNQQDETIYPATDFSSSIPHRERGLAARATYSYNDRYFAEFNAGYNGSENFSPNNRYGFFPAFGVGWLMSEEKFFEPLKNAFSMFKIRYSNGYAGADDGGPRFNYLTFLTDGANGYTFGSNRSYTNGINITNYAVNVTWAKSHKQDLGLDIRTLKDQLAITFDLFQEHRTNILLPRAAVPSFVGLTNNPYGNLGIVDNRGFDASLQDNMNIGKVALTVRANVTYSKNKVIENDQPTPPYPWMNQRGNPVLAQYGYVAEGFFKTQAEIDASAVPGDKSIVKPGDIKYKDLNGDGVINAYDQTKISNGDVPSLVYGFGFNTQYKNFSIGAFFQGTGRADRYISGNAIQPFATNGGISNAFSNITDRWTPDNPNPNAFYPRLAYGDAANSNNTQTSSFWIKDVSFIRLKTMDIGYTFPKALFTKIGVRAARVYLQGYNLLTFSKFKLWDPELNTGNGTTYPNVKTLSLGLSAQFN